MAIERAHPEEDRPPPIVPDRAEALLSGEHPAAAGARGSWRRGVLIGVAVAAAGGTRMAWARAAKPKQGVEQQEEDIGPGEDLMREHGVLRRVLLVHAELLRALRAGEEINPRVLQRTGRLIRSFVEDYHEKQEEDFVFPRFERAGKLVSLVKTLRAQHQAGRAVTDRILALATALAVKDAASREELAARLESFSRMYQAHAAREDTVLFPALHGIMSHQEYDALGQQFERREKQIFQGDGFERAVNEVDQIERLVGIEDLAKLTPEI